MSITKAKDIILDRIDMEIIHGHNAIAVFMAIAEHSQILNKSVFKQVFGSMQKHALDAFILSLCKLYEKPNTRYPNYSIPTTLELLQNDSSELANKKIQDFLKLAKFIQAHIDPSFVVKNESDIKCIPTVVIQYFDKEYPRIDEKNRQQDAKKLNKIFDALKVLRDKRVAHNEEADISAHSKTSVKDALKLLAFAKTYVNIVGYGFFGFSMEGEVSPESFSPDKSVLWPKLNRMIGLLEQQY